MSHKIQTFLELGKHLTLLYVEDSDMVRESTLDMLDEYFEYIDVAVNGEEGLEKYKQFYEENNAYYDVVITDINMPKMNGIKMLEAIHLINPKANIVVTSAHNEAGYLLTLINMGISNFILKPMGIEQIKQVLSRVTQSIKNQKKIEEYHTKMQEANLALRRAKVEADAASRQKSQFLANMSHEIRTPLNAITGFIALLNEKETDPDKLRYLEVIKNSSDSLLQIISDILDTSKIESGKLDIEPVNFNPYNDLIAVAELFQAKAAEKGVVLKILYNRFMPKSLYSDVLRIKQILSNLLSNAVKFSPEGAIVRYGVWYSKGRLNIRVKDYGIGIPQKQQETVFDSFTQVDGTTNKYGGTGLGLAISKQLTELLGGELTLESEEGKGSIFTLSIPMPIGEESKEEPEKLQREEGAIKGHLLIVEDYEANRMFLSIILDNAGVTYEMAHNGIEAVEKFKNGKYDLILMDENMPELGGVGATKKILQIEKDRGLKHTPIISLTANALKGDRERFLQAGMDDYVSKPIEPDKLLSVIKSFLPVNPVR